MTIAGLRALLADPATAVVVVLSKPPHPTVAARVAEAAAGATKPVVFAFLGCDPPPCPSPATTPIFAQTLEDAARQAVLLAGGTRPPLTKRPPTLATSATPKSQQRYVRGLFSGGTFCL